MTQPVVVLVEADPARPRYLLTEAGVGYRLACDAE